jgi:hypothetical protein
MSIMWHADLLNGLVLTAVKPEIPTPALIHQADCIVTPYPISRPKPLVEFMQMRLRRFGGLRFAIKM